MDRFDREDYLTGAVTRLSFLREAPEDAVVVRMFWQDGSRQGSIVVPRAIATALDAEALPSTTSLCLANAISYATFLAMVARTRLFVSGDRSAWNGDWGDLPQAC